MRQFNCMTMHYLKIHNTLGFLLKRFKFNRFKETLYNNLKLIQIKVKIGFDFF